MPSIPKLKYTLFLRIPTSGLNGKRYTVISVGEDIFCSTIQYYQWIFSYIILMYIFHISKALPYPKLYLVLTPPEVSFIQ